MKPDANANIFSRCAELLEATRLKAESVAPLTKSIFEGEGQFQLSDAYTVQRMGLALREQKGEKIVGYKMGFTSKAKMEQMGLFTPIYGVLLDTMKVTSERGFSLTGKIHPKIEPEIAFITSHELKGTITEAQARAACESVVPALEILDSRFNDFKYFSLPDVVADNASSCGFILGTPILLKGREDLALKSIAVAIEEDGKVMHEAQSSAALGDPLTSLCALVQLLWDQKQQSLPAGSIVLTGALTAAIPLKAGQKIRGTYQGFANIDLSIFA